MPRQLKNIFKVKKPPIITGIILGIFVAVFLIGLAVNSFSGGEAIKVVSAKNVYQPSENPQFVFVYKKQANIFSKIFASVKNLFSSDTIEVFASVKVVNAAGEEVEGLNPRIKQDSSREYSVELDHTRFQQEFMPGKYKMKFEIKEKDKTYLQEQEFLWGVLAINTNKSIYLPNEEAYLQIAVLRDDGHTICDAKLKLKIKNQKSKLETELSTEDGTIKYSGKCEGDNVTDVPDYFAYYQVGKPGKYQMTLTNLDNGYSITDYFEVREAVEFDIERIGPTRIFPEADYQMKIKIKANRDFEGQIIETVPMTFAITEKTGANIKPLEDNYAKTISWQMEIKRGEIKELSYSIDFPEISPYFYLIGPLRLISSPEPRASNIFTESRQWQIASDYPCATGTRVNSNQCRVFITTTGSGSWSVPSDWSNVNTIEVIGGGGAGGYDTVDASAGGGGGGYAYYTNLSGLSGNITYSVGQGGIPSSTAATRNGGSTWFNGADCLSSSVCASGGTGATDETTNGVGGTYQTGTGGYTGGNGADSGYNADDGGGGGGGAAGPGGNAGSGGISSLDENGGGGGGGAGDDTPANGSEAVGATGGAGGNGPNESGGGAAGGEDGSDGGGGGGGTDNLTENGGDGGAGTEWGSYGAGGGGGGGADAGEGGQGGLYGGGGGGHGEDGANGTLGRGAQGIIVITYTQAAITVSGNCKQFDQTTNCADGRTVKAAVNGSVDANSGTTNSGSWSITLATYPEDSADIITVWLDGVDDANEAVAVTKWDGSGITITGVNLYERHLVIGSDDNAIVSNSDLAIYDNSVSGDEDIFFDASATSLEVCKVSGCESSELYIAAGNTYRPNSSGSSYVETHDIEIDGTFNLTGTGNYASISGSWNNDGVFTANSSTIFFVASGSAEIVSASVNDVFYNVQFGDSATSSYSGQWTLNGAFTVFDVNNNLTIDAGTLVNSGTKNVTLAGNLSLGTNGAYTKGSGTFTFDGTSKTWADNNSTKSDMGAVTIDGGGTITFQSSVKATSINITSGDTLAAGGAYTLTLTGSGTALTNSGTFTCSTGTVAYEGTSATTVAGLNGNSHYYNLVVGAASDNNTILFSTDGEIEASGSITITSGGTGTHTFDQGNYNVTAEGSPTAITVESGAQWRSNGTGDLVLGGNFSNSGSVSFSANDVECTDGGWSDDISISSTDTNLRTWSGTGTFNLYNITASYQADSSITCYSCTNSGSTSTWTFANCPSGVLYQSHFRWRNDDNNEANATWKRPEDMPHSGQARSQNIRLRFSIKNSGSVPVSNKNYVLQVAPQSQYFTCESVPSESYSDVPTTTAGCGSSVACMTTSPNFANGDSITAQLTAEGTWVAGKMVEDPSNETQAITINNGYYTEIEFNFQLTSNAAYGTNYCFRFTKNGTPLDYYTKVAQITVEGTSLINRLKGALRIKGGTRIK